MKSIIRRLSANPKYSKAMEWGKLISLTGSVQILVQVTALITGVLIIRLLPTEEYAYYTLANTMLGTMTVLADGGISAGVMSQGGKIWKDKQKLGVVLSTGLDLRRKFGVFSLIGALPILGYLLWHQGASYLVIALIILALIPSFFAALSDSLLEIIPKLHQDIKPLQGNQLTVGVIRLILSCCTIFLFPFTFIALLANGIPRIYGNVKLKTITYRFAEKDQNTDPIIKEEILKIVRRNLPGTIYFCLSTQITIWLISLLGTTSSIAEIGALGRLTVVLTVFTVMFQTLIIPRFARLVENKKIIMYHFVKILSGIIVLCLMIIGIVYLFSPQILWALGENYVSLSNELLLSITGGCLGLITGSVFSLAGNRGWVLSPVISIPINIATIALGVIFLSVSTLQGILILNIMIAGVQAIMHVAYFFIKVLKLPTVMKPTEM
jgi:O-antigen/teichoic acid export membrane protein